MSGTNLAGRVALVTGASRGIGRAIALRLARDGADVIVNFAREEAEALSVAAAITALGRQAWPIQADVAVTRQVEAMVAGGIERFQHIDILVSNAGMGSRFGITATTDEEWHKIFGVNVLGFFHTARAVMPGMMERRWGKVVAISSIVGKTGKAFMATSSTYAGAKAAIVGYTRALAREGAPFGINVNCIRPGWIDTEVMLEKVPNEVRQRAITEIPLGRTGRPDDIAGTVSFLVSDDAAYITGQSIDVNGGLFIG